jgi:hypothetical protein
VVGRTADVFVDYAYASASADDVAALQEFLRDGGGVILAAQAWCAGGARAGRGRGRRLCLPARPRAGPPPPLGAVPLTRASLDSRRPRPPAPPLCVPAPAGTRPASRPSPATACSGRSTTPSSGPASLSTPMPAATPSPPRRPGLELPAAGGAGRTEPSRPGRVGPAGPTSHAPPTWQRARAPFLCIPLGSRPQAQARRTQCVPARSRRCPIRCPRGRFCSSLAPRCAPLRGPRAHQDLSRVASRAHALGRSPCTTHLSIASGPGSQGPASNPEPAFSGFALLWRRRWSSSCWGAPFSQALGSPGLIGIAIPFRSQEPRLLLCPAPHPAARVTTALRPPEHQCLRAPIALRCAAPRRAAGGPPAPGAVEARRPPPILSSTRHLREEHHCPRPLPSLSNALFSHISLPSRTGRRMGGPITAPPLRKASALRPPAHRHRPAPAS